MTREEASNILDDFDVNFAGHTAEEIAEAFDVAFKALSQEPMREFTEEESKAYSKALDKMYKPTGFNVFNEPCDDVVSREKAITAIRHAFGWVVRSNPSKEVREIFNKCKENLRDLPPVTQKSGKWIYDRTIENWRCTECDKPPKIRGYVGTLEFMVEHFKYCPNCGAKMVEPQESEDTE